MMTNVKMFYSALSHLGLNCLSLHFPGPQIRVRNWKLFFLFLNQNICCGYSEEPSHRDGSFEHPRHMFRLMDKKIITILCNFFFLLNWPYHFLWVKMSWCTLPPHLITLSPISTLGVYMLNLFTFTVLNCEPHLSPSLITMATNVLLIISHSWYTLQKQSKYN